MEYIISVDADSLLYKACYRHQANFDIELAYMEFVGEIAKIKGRVFDLYKYVRGDTVKALIVLSPATSFRNEMYPEYKANRDEVKKASIVGIEELKALTAQRLPSLVLYVDGVEADDIVNYMARTYNTLVAAIDKDVIHANPTHTFNYNKGQWISPKPQFQIERWYLLQALMGDSTDNIKGAKGVGEKTAEKIVAALPELDFNLIIEHFDDYYDAIMNYRLVRMDQFDGKAIRLWGSIVDDEDLVINEEDIPY